MDDTYAWAMADSSIYRMPLAGGEAQRLRLEGRRESFYWEAVFDGATVVAVEDERLLVWDLVTGRLLLATDPDDIPLRAGRLRSLGVGAGVAVTGTEGGYLLKWDLADGRLLGRTAAHSGDVNRVAISTDSAPIVLSLGGEDRFTVTLCFHDLDGLRRTGEVAVPEPAGCGGWTVLDGQRRAVTVAEDGLLTVWDPVAAAPVAQFPTAARIREALVFIADGACVVLDEDSALRIMDLRDGAVRGTIRTDFTQRVGMVAVHGTFAFAAQGGSTEGRTNLLELTDPLAQDDKDRPYFRDAVPATIDGRPAIIAVEEGGSFEVIDAADGRRFGEPAGERRITLRTAVWYPRPGVVTVGERDLLVVMSECGPTTVDPDTGDTHTAPESSLSPAGPSLIATRNGLITATNDKGVLAVWDAATLTLRASLQLAEAYGTIALALADLQGRTVVLAGTAGGGIRWFDSADLTEITPPGRFAERPNRTAVRGQGLARPGSRHGIGRVRLRRAPGRGRHRHLRRHRHRGAVRTGPDPSEGGLGDTANGPRRCSGGRHQLRRPDSSGLGDWDRPHDLVRHPAPTGQPDRLGRCRPDHRPHRGSSGRGRPRSHDRVYLRISP